MTTQYLVAVFYRHSTKTKRNGMPAHRLIQRKVPGYSDESAVENCLELSDCKRMVENGWLKEFTSVIKLNLKKNESSSSV